MAVLNQETADEIRNRWGEAKGYPDWLVPFLLNYAAMPILARAAREIGKSYWQVKEYIKGKPDLDNFVSDLNVFSHASLEEALLNRVAVSDSLLQFALKSYMPNQFGSKVDVTSDNKPLKTYVVVSPDDWDEGDSPE